MSALWRLLQLADGGFPAGGFAHSGGLEAAVALGEVRGEAQVVEFATGALWQAGTFALPYVAAAHGGEVAALDARCEAALAGHVSRRASRAQGRAWARTCAACFEIDVPGAHLPVAFGASTHALGVALDDTRMLYLHVTARAVLSAAVRLGALGPHAAQRAHDRLATVADAVLTACAGRSLDDAAHSAPLHELFGNLHDALPARLFQS